MSAAAENTNKESAAKDVAASTTPAGEVKTANSAKSPPSMEETTGTVVSTEMKTAMSNESSDPKSSHSEVMETPHESRQDVGVEQSRDTNTKEHREELPEDASMKKDSGNYSTSSQSKSSGSRSHLPDSQQHHGRYYSNMQPPSHGHYGAPRGGPYGGPYPYPSGSNGPFPPSYHHSHPPHHMPPMPHYNGKGSSGGPHHYTLGGGRSNGSNNNGSYYPNPSNGYSYPSSHGMPPSYPSMSTSDSASISSKGSKGSKKRTIDGVHESDYAFRRSNSNGSTASTVTVGNNTSIETHGTEDTGSYHGHDHMHMGDDYSESRPARSQYHRRNYSADGSTTSTLSGNYSMASYERGNDAMISEKPLHKASPKRMKNNEGEPLLVDTVMRPPSVASHDSVHFEQLSLGVKEEGPLTGKSEGTEESSRALFLTLSTSPINGNADVDATPISKNTMRQQQIADKSKTASIFKKKGALASLEVSTSDDHRSPRSSGHVDTDMSDDRNTLDRHLRIQTFTPTAGGDNGSAHADGHFGSLAPQLSWSIAGDTPSLSDLAEWDEGSKKSSSADHKLRPSSTVDSHESRNSNISPHDFQLFKESDHELMEGAMDGATTPLPAFFESRGSGDDHHESSAMKSKHHGDDASRPTFITSSNRNYHHGRQQMPHHQPHWKHDHMGHNVPPTPMYHASEYRDDAYPMVRSPYSSDRRDQIEGAYPFYGPPPGMHSSDRVRNLRGRMPPGAPHYPPMQMPHPMSAQLPMTSPMALPNKAGGFWSPHGGLPPLSSPHHMGSPMGAMSQTKRKCVPLKPPIPSKFQGDPEKVKNVPVPEFTSLVNFPSHMSQKQAVNLPEGMRCCVMCGQACPCSHGGKNKNKKKGDGGLSHRNGNHDMHGEKTYAAQIPTQNKGLCTLCDVSVWVVTGNGLEIKWCKGCKNFRPWAAFGDKGTATKCSRCRERQREKYALQKEEKEKKARSLKAQS